MALKIDTASEWAQTNYNLTQILNSANGIEKVASESLPPFIRETRDYAAFCRKVLMVHNITSEQTHLINQEPVVYYPKDLNAHAALMSDDAEVPRYQVEGSGVNVPVITIMSDNHTIHIKRLMVEKFQYLERVRELAGDAIAQVEDRKLLNLINKLLAGTSTDLTKPDNADQIVTSTNTSLQKNALIELQQKIVQNDIPVGCYVMNQATHLDVLKWGFGVNGADIDWETQRDQLRTGAQKSFWQIPIYTCRLIPKNVVYCFADKQYVGRMPILKDLTVELTSANTKLEKGLFMYEFVGFYLASQKAVSKLILGYTDGDPLIEYLPDGSFGREKELVGDIKGFGSQEEDD